MSGSTFVGGPRSPDAEPLSLYNDPTLAADMNRPSLFPPSPPPASPPPVHSRAGVRAWLAIRFRAYCAKGASSVLARVRRDLIDDSEAPTPDEVAEYPEVKSLVKKIEKDGSFAPRASDKELAAPNSRYAWRPSARSTAWPTSACARQATAPSPSRSPKSRISSCHHRRAMAASAIWRCRTIPRDAPR